MARKYRRASSTGDDEVNLTPMLDVTFILLIFFIVTAQFIKEPGPDVERPEVRNDGRINPLGILIAIDENSQIFIAKRQVEPAEVTFRIRELRRDNPKGEIVIQADANSRVAILDSVISSVQTADPSAAINVSSKID